jgi:hypothetical protein
MPVSQFVRWYPVYWVLSAIDQLLSVLTFTIGAVAGALIFALIFTLPPQSAPHGILFLALVVGSGFYIQSWLSRRWKSAFNRITERMERGIGG